LRRAEPGGSANAVLRRGIPIASPVRFWHMRRLLGRARRRSGGEAASFAE